MGKKKVSLSEENLIPDDIAVQQKILQESIRAYYRKPPYWLFEEYCNSSKSAFERDLENRCIEVERDGILTLLAAIEALFKVDFFERVYSRKKGHLSRTFRELYKQQTNNRIGLNAIFKEWIDAENGSYSKLINALQGAFKYRHWLAHGRYWVPKYGQKYDFDSVYVLARETFEILNETDTSLD